MPSHTCAVGCPYLIAMRTARRLVLANPVLCPNWGFRPSQALETYQCLDPTSRTTCPTDAPTDIAGLASVLPRLIGLPTTATTPALVARWKQHLALLPALPTGVAKKNASYSPQKLLPATAGAPSRHNSENTELYVREMWCHVTAPRAQSVGATRAALGQMSLSAANRCILTGVGAAGRPPVPSFRNREARPRARAAILPRTTKSVQRWVVPGLHPGRDA